MAEEKPSAGGSGGEKIPSADGDFPFNLNDDELEDVLRHPEIRAFLAERGFTVAQFKAWLRTRRARKRFRKVPERAAAKAGQSKIRAEAQAEAATADSDPPEDDEAFRAQQLQRLRDYAAAAECEAVMARKMADDGAVAMEHGTTLPPHSVLEIQRQG